MLPFLAISGTRMRKNCKKKRRENRNKVKNKRWGGRNKNKKVRESELRNKKEKLEKVNEGSINPGIENKTNGTG